MREFFVLSYDEADDLETVSDYEMDAFDLTAFWTGQRFEGSIPEGVRLWVSKGNPTDFMGNPLSWQIGSQRLWSIIRPLVESDCQEVFAPLYYEHSHSPVTEYLLLNPTRLLAAARQTDKDEDVSIGDLVLDLGQIPADVNMFRLVGSSTVILVSDAVVEAVWGKGLKGLAFLSTKQG